MAKKSAVERNNKRAKLAAKYAARRANLKAAMKDPNASPEDRFQAALKLQAIPRNASPIRYRNRCDVSGRPRGVYRKFKLGRVMLRDLASNGQIPGMVKSSW